MSANTENLVRALLAAGRIIEDKYLSWHHAGGVNDCKHGYGEGIPCPKCDRETVLSVLAAHKSQEPRYRDLVPGERPTADEGDIYLNSKGVWMPWALNSEWEIREQDRGLFRRPIQEDQP